MQVQIDAAQIDALQPLWLQLHAHHQTVAPELQPFVDPVTSWKARRNLYVHAMETGGTIRVARDGERQVGYLVTSWEPSPWPATLVSPEKVMELVSIHVDPAYRGRGVGSSLLAAFDAELLRAGSRVGARVGTRQCFLGAIPGNSRAVELYLRRGFQATSFLMMRFGRELPPPVGGGPLAVDVVSASEVESLRDVWIAAHRWRRSAGSSLGEFVSDDDSWGVIRKGLVEAARAGLLFCAGGRGFAYAAMTDSAVLSDTWVTHPGVAEISIVTVPAADGPARALLHSVEDALVRLDVTDHIVNVMASDTETIRLCQDGGFLPGWLQLSRFVG